MAILADPARTVQHTSFCNQVWHEMEMERAREVSAEEPDYPTCESSPIEIPTGTSHGDALIYQCDEGAKACIEFPHQILYLSADQLDDMVETLTRLAVTLRASQ